MPRLARTLGALTGLALFVGLSYGPSEAQAANGTHPRTRVIWDDGAVCGVIVTQSEGSLNLPYTLPDVNEDGQVDTCDDDPTPSECGEPIYNPVPGPDEVAGSRKHQFFGFCRQHPLDELLPSWVNQSDVDAAAAVEACCDPMDCPGPMCPLLDPLTLTEEDVIDSSEWAGCVERINADDDRSPITAAQAAMGIDWDLSTVDPGVYGVEGYTWEPAFNVWSRRPGFVKVVENSSDAASWPAAAIMRSEESKADDNIIDGCETVTLVGCVDAGEGATFDAFWRLSAAGEPIEWHRFMADEPIEDGNFEIEWEPENLPAGLLLVRIDVKSECGVYTAHAPFAMNVSDGPECEDGSVFMDGGEPDDFIDTQNNRDENSCVGDSGTGGDAAEEKGGGGCSCRQTDLYAGLPLLALLPLLRRRRGRR